MTNLIILLICIPIVFMLSTVRFQKVKVPFTELPQDFQDNYLRKHPAFAWKIGLVKSFDSYTKDYQELFHWWKDNSSSLKSPTDMYVLSTSIEQVCSLLEICGKRLKNTKRIIIHMKLWFMSPEKLTRKMFGKEIEGLYFHHYILKEGKESLSNAEIDDTKILNSWRTALGRLNPIFYEPIFSKEIVNNARAYASRVVNDTKKSA